MVTPHMDDTDEISGDALPKEPPQYDPVARRRNRQAVKSKRKRQKQYLGLVIAVVLVAGIAIAGRAAVGVRAVAIVHPVGRRIGHEADLLNFIVYCRLQQGVKFRGFLRGDTRIRDFNGE